jgi:hypothetical protein|tara:strand:+ start:181 stop:2481 length:2301 start_codon:yes stop_codon:yes gene_type:complete
MATHLSPPLNGLGVITNLYEYLWSRDELDARPQVTIPDTVLYRNGKPKRWYFTSTNGEVKRKNGTNVTVLKVEEEFTKKAFGCDVIATFIRTSMGDAPGAGGESGAGAAAEGGDGEEEEGGEGGGSPTRGGTEAGPFQPTIEYLDREAFHAFLYNRKGRAHESGLLQRFVQPKGTRNTMIRSIWSPKVCLLERRENNRKLADTRYDIYERSVTFEGTELNTRSAPVRGSILPPQLQRLNDAIVDHIKEVSFSKYCIARLVLNFKVDYRGKLVLVFCSALRLSAPSGSVPPLDFDVQLAVPSHVRLFNSTGYAQASALRMTFQCPSCPLIVEESRTYEIPYKTVIAHFRRVKQEASEELMMADQDGREPSMAALETTSAVAGLFNSTATESMWLPSTNQQRSPSKMGQESGAAAEGAILIGLGAGGSAQTVDKVDALVVPPTIAYLHPSLGVDAYLRFERDPLFLFKTANVCESCYLGYAGVATNLMEAQMGRGAGGMQTTSAAGATQGKSWANRGRIAHQTATSTRRMQEVLERRAKAQRAQEERRRRTTKAQTGKQLLRSGMNASAGRATMDLRQPMPSLPKPIDLDSMPARTNGGGGSSTIAGRENDFFHELYQSPNLNQSHPLKHMAMVEDVRRRATMGDGRDEEGGGGGDSVHLPQLPASKTVGRGGARSRRGVPAKLVPYATLQTVLQNPADAKGKAKAKARSRRRKAAYQAPAHGEGLAAMSPKGSFPVMKESASALQHRQFLMETLKLVHNQLEADEDE